MHNLSKLGYTSINLDLSKTSSAFAADMMPLAAVCRAKLLEGVDIMLELPTDAKLARLFNNCNWSHLIDPRTHEQSAYKPHHHLPALIYKDSKVHFQTIDQIMELLLRQLDGFTRDHLAALEWAINEITDNVLNHAESPIGGVVQVSINQKRGLLEVVVCDAGHSIPVTLGKAHPSITSDTDALDRAIREGVTRNSQTNMGNGLFGSYRVSQLSKGHFSIYSRYATLDFKERTGLHVTREDIPFPGTVVVCGIKLDNPEVLLEALSFKGEQHTPGYTYVDRATEEDVVVLRLKEQSASFGSREAGKGLKNKIMTLARTSSGKIILDLMDVPLISSSFADEVFGKIFSELGPMNFMAKIQIVGGNAVVRQLIDRAIAQRMALLAKPSP
jgi:anti-sigma regulatory factor (Ser/Thr protein kinase)